GERDRRSPQVRRRIFEAEGAREELGRVRLHAPARGQRRARRQIAQPPSAENRSFNDSRRSNDSTASTTERAPSAPRIGVASERNFSSMSFCDIGFARSPFGTMISFV